MTAATESGMHALVVELRDLVKQRDIALAREKERNAQLAKENAALRKEVAGRSTTALVRKNKP